MKMREIAIDKSIPYEKQKQIRDEQIKKYNKYKFMMGLRDAVQRQVKQNDNVDFD